MRILVLGDGPTDLGRFAGDGACIEKGAVPQFVESILRLNGMNQPIEFRIAKWSQKRLFPRKGSGYQRKVLLAAASHDGKTSDAIIAVVDRDGAENNGRIKELNEARHKLAARSVKCAVGMAIETIEAWLLADDNALRVALRDNSIGRQTEPESLNSLRSNNDRNPKYVLRLLVDRSPDGPMQANDCPTVYARIANAADPAVIAKRCPKGFQPFVKQVADLLES